MKHKEYKQFSCSRTAFIFAILAACFLGLFISTGFYWRLHEDNVRPDVKWAEHDIVRWEWSLKYGYITTEEASARLSKLKEFYGDSFNRLPSERKASAYKLMANFFFMEGNYPSAFSFYIQLFENRTGVPIEEVIFLSYVAGLAGQKEWLKEEIEKAKLSNPQYALYSKINLAWARNEFSKVIFLADSFLDSYDERDRLQNYLAIWAGFLRAKALLQLKKPEEALSEILTYPNFYEFGIDTRNCFIIHFYLQLAEIYKEIGDYEKVYYVYEFVKKIAPLVESFPQKKIIQINGDMRRLAKKLGRPLSPEKNYEQKQKYNNTEGEKINNNWLNTFMLDGLLELH